jgi:WhiB family transcriptional regulator, redox-sensing transcriptional regulator
MTANAPDPLAWWHRAACRGADPDLFFPVAADDSPAYARQVAEAKAVCSGCPVRPECLAYAMEAMPAHGIWAGTTPQERHSERRRLARQRRAA